VFFFFFLAKPFNSLTIGHKIQGDVKPN